MMFHELVVQSFLAQHRVVLVGASENPKRFGNTIYRELRAHGYEVVPVNPNGVMVEGELCYPDLASVPGVVDGVMVMVTEKSVENHITRIYQQVGIDAHDPATHQRDQVALLYTDGMDAAAYSYGHRLLR